MTRRERFASRKVKYVRKKPFKSRKKKIPMTGPIIKKHRIPLISEEVLKETRTTINARNKARSRAMEVRIAKYLTVESLTTDRTPMSGAMKAYKGDCIGYYAGGKFMIECKLTQMRDSSDIPHAIIQHAWLPKMHEEARSIRAKFAVLIVHFVGKNYEEDYVFIHHIDAMRFKHPSIPTMLSTLYTRDTTYKSDGVTLVKLFNIHKERFNKTRSIVNGIYYQNIMTPHGLYLTIMLRDFRDILLYESNLSESNI